jgi:hypothetical protein
MRGAVAFGAILLLAAACGNDEGGAAAPGDASADGRCAPVTMSGWMPTWRPPAQPSAVCTDAQLERQFALCEAATATEAECFAWNRDPANSACFQCLYSTEDEPTYGPVIYMKNRSRTVNIAGCLALLDGDRSAAGCGAEYQASSECRQASCIQSCPVYDEFQQCMQTSGRTVCAKYSIGNVCGDASMYAKCLDFDSFEDYYRSFARLFCGTPLDAGAPQDSGPARDSGSPDGSTTQDASTPQDSGGPRDGATPQDSGTPQDGATPRDAATQDAVMTPDGDASRDGDASSDGGPLQLHASRAPVQMGARPTAARPGRETSGRPVLRFPERIVNDTPAGAGIGRALGR